jgi:methionyl aminopeptidase
MSRKVHYRSDDEIATLKESSLLVGKTLAEVAKHVEVGATTRQLDGIAETFIRDHGASPSFKGYGGFPGSLCTSVNEQVVHGIPNDIPLESGDVVSVDCGVYMNGFHGDSAFTFEVGEVAEPIRKLLRVTRECLDKAIEQAVEGNHIGDIGYACQQHAEENGYGVVRELVGHGLGRDLHEAPEVPNYGRKGKGMELKEGMILAIEPMINLGSKAVLQLDDGWTIITKDRKVSAHFEHDIAIRKGKAEVLSTFSYIEDVLKKKNELVN